jgi:acyl carrier protein
MQGLDMDKITPERVRHFLLAKYAPTIEGIGLNPAELPDSFDFLDRGIIDSFGVLDMIMSIENEFQIQVDMATLDAEQVTILGPLSRYVAENAQRD